MNRPDGTLGHALHKTFGTAAVMNEIRDRANFEPMPCGKFDKIRQTRHTAIVLQDFADYGGGLNPARAAKSQPASVWPARTSTPPVCAINGKMCPG